jgi:hypothetical protein
MLYLAIRRPTMAQLPQLRQRPRMGKCHQWSVPFQRTVLSTSPLSTPIPTSIITELFITLRLDRLSTPRVHITPARRCIVLKIVTISNTMGISNHLIPLLEVTELLEKLAGRSMGWLDRHRTIIPMARSTVRRMDLSHLNMKREIVWDGLSLLLIKLFGGPINNPFLCASREKSTALNMLTMRRMSAICYTVSWEKFFNLVSPIIIHTE